MVTLLDFSIELDLLMMMDSLSNEIQMTDIVFVFVLSQLEPSLE